MKAVVLDFDGVIADTLHINFEVKAEAFRPYGIELSLQEFIDIWVSPEPGKEGTPYFVKLKGLKISPEESLRGQRAMAQNLFRERAEPMPGALELIKLLKGMNLRVGIVSSNYKKSVGLFLRKFGIEKDFEFVVASEDCKRHKPFPDPYLMAVKRFGLSPGQILAVEDADTGVESAKLAGCAVLAVPNRFTEHEDFSKADLVLKSLGEIDEKLLSQF
ncbi:MAG: HAD family phosphatase [Candidatus Diapherotrites archaeon]|uniref:HAD family phosphatase n=1 Tax=Candidatus Iainarchaeum sp. TaxID=3101447 RepID=A0A939C8I4_9ARCH|nr:HAD family phosphatase [Candidatus Diapherotrites archaeon]